MAAMAIEPGENEFDVWLGEKLRELNTDEGVFGSYIKGILNGDESYAEKAEALEEIITEITVRNLFHGTKVYLTGFYVFSKSDQYNSCVVYDLQY